MFKKKSSGCESMLKNMTLFSSFRQKTTKIEEKKSPHKICYSYQN